MAKQSIAVGFSTNLRFHVLFQCCSLIYILMLNKLDNYIVSLTDLLFLLYEFVLFEGKFFYSKDIFILCFVCQSGW
jgi:hypothetical protein